MNRVKLNLTQTKNTNVSKLPIYYSDFHQVTNDESTSVFQNFKF